MVICPGGGYNILAIEHEGTEVAAWLNSIGVTGVVLKYRVPRRKDLEKHDAPLQDVQRAVSLVRHHGKEWGLDPKRIGILGFSAGGHLSAAALTGYDKPHYKPVDAIDKANCRPDFGVLIYPAYLVDKETKSKLSPELRITKTRRRYSLFMLRTTGCRRRGAFDSGRNYAATVWALSYTSFQKADTVTG